MSDKKKKIVSEGENYIDKYKSKDRCKVCC